MSCYLDIIPARCAMAQSHLPDTCGFPPPWHPPHTVAGVFPPRSDDEQGDTGFCLIPLVGGGPSRTTATSQGWGAPGGLWGRCGLILVGQHFSSSLPEPVPPTLRAVSPPSGMRELGGSTKPLATGVAGKAGL